MVFSLSSFRLLRISSVIIVGVLFISSILFVVIAKKETYYETLQIEENASEKEIKKAYHKLAKEFHPDKQQAASERDRTLAEDKFKEIAQAYEILSDPQKKQFYDENELHEEESSSGGGGWGGWGGNNDGRAQQQAEKVRFQDLRNSGIPGRLIKSHTKIQNQMRTPDGKNKIYLFHVHSDFRHLYGEWMKKIPTGTIKNPIGSTIIDEYGSKKSSNRGTNNNLIEFLHVNVFNSEDHLVSRFLGVRRYPVIVGRYKGRKFEHYPDMLELMGANGHSVSETLMKKILYHLLNDEFNTGITTIESSKGSSSSTSSRSSGGSNGFDDLRQFLAYKPRGSGNLRFLFIQKGRSLAMYEFLKNWWHLGRIGFIDLEGSSQQNYGIFGSRVSASGNPAVQHLFTNYKIDGGTPVTLDEALVNSNSVYSTKIIVFDPLSRRGKIVKCGEFGSSQNHRGQHDASPEDLSTAVNTFANRMEKVERPILLLDKDEFRKIHSNAILEDWSSNESDQNDSNLPYLALDLNSFSDLVNSNTNIHTGGGEVISETCRKLKKEAKIQKCVLIDSSRLELLDFSSFSSQDKMEAIIRKSNIFLLHIHKKSVRIVIPTETSKNSMNVSLPVQRRNTVETNWLLYESRKTLYQNIDSLLTKVRGLDKKHRLNTNREIAVMDMKTGLFITLLADRIFTPDPPLVWYHPIMILEKWNTMVIGSITGFMELILSTILGFDLSDFTDDNGILDMGTIIDFDNMDSSKLFAIIQALFWVMLFILPLINGNATGSGQKVGSGDGSNSNSGANAQKTGTSSTHASTSSTSGGTSNLPNPNVGGAKKVGSSLMTISTLPALNVSLESVTTSLKFFALGGSDIIKRLREAEKGRDTARSAGRNAVIFENLTWVDLGPRILPDNYSKFPENSICLVVPKKKKARILTVNGVSAGRGEDVNALLDSVISALERLLDGEFRDMLVYDHARDLVENWFKNT